MVDPHDLQTRMLEPSDALLDTLDLVDGDISIVGAGGKLGPSLALLAAGAARREGRGRRVIAVSRFSDPEVTAALGRAGVEVVRADVADDDALASLEVSPNQIFLVGTKFGSTGNEASVWNTNAYLPGRVSRHFRGSRQVVLSTGTIYPFVEVASGGAIESTPPDPVGEYAMSCLGRERSVEHVSRTTGTPVTLIRLNYAVEMTYGVLVDLAKQITAGTPIDRSSTAVNVVWQGWVNEVILRSLAIVASPPRILNVTGPETASVEYLATRLAAALDREVSFVGDARETALLANAAECFQLFGYPSVVLGELVEATARWVRAGNPVQEKPTKFELRDGRF